MCVNAKRKKINDKFERRRSKDITRSLEQNTDSIQQEMCRKRKIRSLKWLIFTAEISKIRLKILLER